MIRLVVWMAIIGALFGPGIVLAAQLPGTFTDIPELSDGMATGWHYGTTYGVPISGALIAGGGLAEKLYNRRQGNGGAIAGVATGVIMQFVPGGILGAQKVAPAATGLRPLAPWFERFWQGLTLQSFWTDPTTVLVLAVCLLLLVHRARTRSMLV